jgi:hypothetical protein
MYCSEDKDDEASGLCFSLAKRVKGYLIKCGEPNGHERTEARIGYTFAPRNHPERPKAIPTSAQRTIGTGITHSTCCEIYESTSVIRFKISSLRQGSRRIDHIPTQQLLRSRSIHQLLSIAGLAIVEWEVLSHKRILGIQQC